MCRCVCGRACAGEEREIATYSRLVRPENWVGEWDITETVRKAYVIAYTEPQS